MKNEIEYRSEYLDTIDDDGNQWRICYTYTEQCVQRGNYSAVAADPDEYYGVYTYAFDGISWAEITDSADGEYYELIDSCDGIDFPEWMIDEVMDEIEGMN